MKSNTGVVSSEYRSALLNALRLYKARVKALSKTRAEDLLELESIVLDEGYHNNSDLTKAVLEMINQRLVTGFLLFNIKSWRISTGKSRLKKYVLNVFTEFTELKLLKSEVCQLEKMMQEADRLDKTQLSAELEQTKSDLAEANVSLEIEKSKGRSLEIEMTNMQCINEVLTQHLNSATLERLQLKQEVADLREKVDVLLAQFEGMYTFRQEGNEKPVGADLRVCPLNGQLDGQAMKNP
jgi:hypothetical protein